MYVHSTIDNYLWPNEYLLSFVGLWPIESDRHNCPTTKSGVFDWSIREVRKLFAIMIIFTLLVPLSLMVIVYWGDISVLTELGCIALPLGRLVYKMIYTASRQQQLFSIYRKARELWLVTDDKEDRRTFESLALLAKQFTIAFFVVCMCNVILLTTMSVIVWVNNYHQYHRQRHVINQTIPYTRNLPLQIWYGFDTQRSPNFEITFCQQLLAMSLGVISLVGFDSTMMTFILHTCGQFRLIQVRLRAIGDMIRDDTDWHSKNQWVNDATADRIIHPRLEIGKCIKHHQFVIRIADEINTFLTPVIFIHLTFSGVEICLSGFALQASIAINDGVEIVKFIMFDVFVFLQMIMWCWPGELLIQESTAVVHAICHDLPWYTLAAGQQRDLVFLLLRAQKKCRIRAIGSHAMSLEKLTDVFNTAASYFALLRSVSDKQM